MLSSRKSLWDVCGCHEKRCRDPGLHLHHQEDDGHCSLTEIIVERDSYAAQYCKQNSLPYQYGEFAPARIPGDANEDGMADIFDALLVLQYDAGWDVELNEANGDVNGDGAADIFDALLLLQYDAGWDVELK